MLPLRGRAFRDAMSTTFMFGRVPMPEQSAAGVPGSLTPEERGRDLLKRLEYPEDVDGRTRRLKLIAEFRGAVVAEEREACAKEAELWKRTTGSEFDPDDDIDRTCLNIAAAIRVRG